jgi:hypothetical protein
MRARSYVLVILLIYCCLIANFSTDVDVMAQSVPRLIISIYKYSGIRTQRQESEFDAFKEIIEAKILKLSQEIGVEGTSLDYVSRLMPSFVSDLASNENLPFTGSRKDLYDHWYTSGALEVLLGRIRSTGSVFSVRSEVFLGDLKGNLKKESVTLDLPISDEQFDTTRDSHTIATLYALAVDAQKRKRPDNEVFAFLSEAYERLPDLPEQMPGIRELKKAIITTINQIRNQNKMDQQ